MLLVAGYSIILILDKVLFDTHSLLHDDHGESDDHAMEKTDNLSRVVRASMALRQSIHEMSRSQHMDDEIEK